MQKYVKLVEEINAEEPEVTSVLKGENDLDFPLYAVLYLLQNQDDPKSQEALQLINAFMNGPKIQRYVSTLLKPKKAEEMDDKTKNAQYLHKLVKKHTENFRKDSI